MSLLFIAVYTAWLASEILLNRFLRGSNTDQQQKDKGSLSFMWIIIIASIVVAGFIGHSTHRPIGGNAV